MAAATADNLAVLGFSDILNQNVAEVIPCSPLQEGILPSPSSYAVYILGVELHPSCRRLRRF